MAATAGVTRTAPQEHISRTVSLVRAALELWEAKHGRVRVSTWTRRSKLQPE